ncbi:MAG: nickel insertion protein, partial [Phascolarctobacterium sp.]
MRSLLLECNAGVSGDMLVAALLDLGADREALDKALKSIPAQGFTYKISRVKKAGIDCCDFDVILDCKYANHDHDMEYLHGDAHEHHHEHEHEHSHAAEEDEPCLDHELPSHMPENEHLLDHGNERAYHDGFYNEHDYMHEHEIQPGHEFLQAHQPHILANHVDDKDNCCIKHEHEHHHQ